MIIKVGRQRAIEQPANQVNLVAGKKVRLVKPAAKQQLVPAKQEQESLQDTLIRLRASKNVDSRQQFLSVFSGGAN